MQSSAKPNKHQSRNGEDQLTWDPFAPIPAKTAQLEPVPSAPEPFLIEEENTSDEDSSQEPVIDPAWKAKMHHGPMPQPNHEAKAARVPEAPRRGKPIPGVPRRFTFSDNDIERSFNRDRYRRSTSPISIKTLLVNPGANRNKKFAEEKERERREKEKEAAARAALLRVSANAYQLKASAQLASGLQLRIAAEVGAEKQREAARAAAMMQRPSQQHQTSAIAVSTPMLIPSSAQPKQQLAPPAQAPKYCYPGRPSSSVVPMYAPPTYSEATASPPVLPTYSEAVASMPPSASSQAASVSYPQPPQIIQIEVLTESGTIKTDLPKALRLMNVYDPVKLLDGFHPDIVRQINQIKVDLPIRDQDQRFINTSLYNALQYMNKRPHQYDSSIRQHLYRVWGIIPSTGVNLAAVTSTAAKTAKSTQFISQPPQMPPATTEVKSVPAPVLSAALPASSVSGSTAVATQTYSLFEGLAPAVVQRFFSQACGLASSFASVPMTREAEGAVPASAVPPVSSQSGAVVSRGTASSGGIFGDWRSVFPDANESSWVLPTPSSYV